MGESTSRLHKPRFLLRTFLVSAVWVLGAISASRIPENAAPRSAAELVAPAPLPPDHPSDAHRGSRPAEAPPLMDPPAPAPA